MLRCMCCASAHTGTTSCSNLTDAWRTLSDTHVMSPKLPDAVVGMQDYGHVDVPSTLTLLTPYKLMWLLLKK